MHSKRGNDWFTRNYINDIFSTFKYAHDEYFIYVNDSYELKFLFNAMNFVETPE